MYDKLDSLLAVAKKKVKTEFNRLDVMGFDELNVVNTRKTTQAMFDQFLADNEEMYLKAAKDAYKKAAKSVEYSGEMDESLVAGVLAAYNFVTGYLYEKEAERKRLRLNEQILTAREYDNRQMYHDSLQRTANLWWTQTAQYGIDMVDAATIRAFKDADVKHVRWIAADDDKTCSTCNERDGKIYEISKIPGKPHYGCRCYVEPVNPKE